MKDKNIMDAVESFAPSKQQKERIYEKVASGQPSISKKTKRSRAAVACAAACLVLAIAAAVLLSSPGAPNNTALLESGGAQTSEPEMSGASPAASTAFSGFVFTAYRPVGGEGYLDANYEEEAEQLALIPDVEVLLARYSPAMSCVPGLPFTVGLPDGADIDAIRISADGGALCEWDQDTGIVAQKGGSAAVDAGGTIYWSPVGGEEGVDIVSATIAVEAVTDGAAVGIQQIVITRDEQGWYHATAGEPESI